MFNSYTRILSNIERKRAEQEITSITSMWLACILIATLMRPKVSTEGGSPVLSSGVNGTITIHRLLECMCLLIAIFTYGLLSGI